MAQINFGKFSGWDTENLARTTEGRQYLKWGFENLKSPQWRKEFSAALKRYSFSDLDVDLEAKMILASDPQIDENDAEMLARETLADIKEQEKADKVIDRTFANLRKNLANVGVPAQHLNRIFSIIVDGSLDEMVAAKVVQFSSQEKMENVLSCAAQYEIELENL